MYLLPVVVVLFWLATAVIPAFAEDPDCTITAPEQVCAGSTGHTASVADAGQDASYTWIIKNGIITTANNNSIIWDAGTVSPVTIAVIVNDGVCCSCEDSVEITVNQPPPCIITAPTSVNGKSTGNTASVADAGAGASYSWTISNGVITGGANSRAITWNAGNSSPVTLSVTVTSAQGCSCRDSINVNVTPIPIADFTATPSTGCVPLPVQFNDTSTGCPLTWSWNFGDGGTSTEKNPAHQYAVPGIYTVSLTVTNSHGSNTASRQGYITAQNCSLTPPTVTTDPPRSTQKGNSSENSEQHSWAQPSNIITTQAWAQPRTAKAGQQVTIYANIANRGDIQGSFIATLMINGKVEDTKEGSLEGNTAMPLEFSVSRKKAGTYTVDINGQKTYFTIVESDGGTRYIGLVFGILFIFTFVILAFVVQRRWHHSYRSI